MTANDYHPVSLDSAQNSQIYDDERQTKLTKVLLLSPDWVHQGDSNDTVVSVSTELPLALLVIHSTSQLLMPFQMVCSVLLTVLHLKMLIGCEISTANQNPTN